MKRPSVKWLAVAAAGCIFASSMGTYTYTALADEFVYTDANVSITSIVDRYIEENGGDVFTADATPEDATAPAAVVAEATATDAVATGEIQEIAKVTGEIAEVPSEETTEAPATEEPTTEAPVQEASEAAASPVMDFTGKAIVTASGSVNIRVVAQAGNVDGGSAHDPLAGPELFAEAAHRHAAVALGNVAGQQRVEPYPLSPPVFWRHEARRPRRRLAPHGVADVGLYKHTPIVFSVGLQGSGLVSHPLRRVGSHGAAVPHVAHHAPRIVFGRRHYDTVRLLADVAPGRNYLPAETGNGNVDAHRGHTALYREARKTDARCRRRTGRHEGQGHDDVGKLHNCDLFCAGP